MSELRITYGPGYQIYYLQRGDEVVILLCGGDRGSERSNIAAAKALVREMENYDEC